MMIRQKKKKMIAVLTATLFTAGMVSVIPGSAKAGKKSDNLIMGIAAGAAGLAIIHALNKKNKRKAAPPVRVAQPPRYTPPRYRRPRYTPPRYRPRPRGPVRSYYPPRIPRAVYSPDTQSIQQSLNAIGFNVGLADGLMGRSTRAGVSQFQRSLGYPATGYLSPPQKGILFQRARGGGVTPAGYPGVARPVAPGYRPPAYPPARPVAPGYTPATVYGQPGYTPRTGGGYYVPPRPSVPAYPPVRTGGGYYVPPATVPGYAPPRTGGGYYVPPRRP